MEQIYKLYSSLGTLENGKKWAEIDLSALRHNYRTLKQAVAPSGSPRTIAVLKADAYGHGAPECVCALLEEHCDFFAVSCIDEAIAVRQVCRLQNASADILVLGYTPPSFASVLAENDIIQALLSPDYAEELNRCAKQANVTVRVHIAVDTGMNRIGFVCRSKAEIRKAAEEIAALSTEEHLKTEGMFSHFACADEPEGSQGELLTNQQSLRYRELTDYLNLLKIRIPFHHLCNSIAALHRPDDRMDGVRFGIFLYGPYANAPEELHLLPVMKLKTIISHLHIQGVGDGVSYGGTHRASEERLIATLPIGYADGFLRSYTGSSVTVHTASGPRSAPIVGNICMDQCMIDVTGTDAAVGDPVTLFGDGNELNGYAKRANTLDYECLCLISSRVPRIYSSASQKTFEPIQTKESNHENK